MLVIMTFNVQYFISIVFGVFVAHFSTNLFACKNETAADSNNVSRRGNFFYFSKKASNIIWFGFVTISSGALSSTTTSSTPYLSFSVPGRDQRKESIMSHDCCS